MTKGGTRNVQRYETGSPSHHLSAWTGKTFALSLLALAWWLSGGFANAQMAPDPGLGKPTPVNGEVSAIKGETITIELVSEAKTRAAVVEFLIRDFPRNGELGQMISDEKNRTKVTIKYTPFADSAATTDSFTYAVRYPGGLWSQKAKVELTLESSEPKIHATAEADFGDVMLGKSEDREIFLSNSGNASYRNQLQLPPPWSFVEPVNGLLNVPVGGQQVIKIRYTPVIEGPSEYQLTFFRNQGASTKLKAKGYAPFVVEAQTITLKWEEKSRTRIGEITVTGKSPQLLPTTVAVDERLQATGGGAMYLPLNEPATFQVYLPPTDTEVYQGQLEIVAGDFRIPISVSADIAPGYVLVENTGTGERMVDFGALEPGEIAQGSFQLRNAGGSPVSLRLSAEAPFTVLAAGGRANLDPQETESFAVRVTAPEGIHGAYNGVLLIEADNGQILKVDLKTVFLGSNEDPNAMLRQQASAPGLSSMPPPPPSSDSSVSSADRPPGPSPDRVAPPTQEEINRAIEEMDRYRSPLGFVTFPTVEREIAPTVPGIAADKLRLVEEDRRHLTVGWALPSIGYDKFELEMRMMRMTSADGIVESVWVPYNDVAFSASRSGEIHADIRGLSPNHTYEFRVFTLGDDSKVSEPLAFVAKTKMPLDWTWIYISFGILVLGGLGWLIWRRLRHESRPTKRFSGYSRVSDLIRGLD